MVSVSRSDYPFTYWTQVAVLAVLDFLLLIAAFKSANGCIS
jgi:hypothetical protein